MSDTQHPGVTPIAIVGVGAVLPDAPDVDAFWDNLTNGRSAITDVPPQRWDPELYYDPDHAVPDKTYSRIGGWVRDFTWEPAKWKLPIPPRVAEQMDEGQRWAVACARSALLDAGWPDWNVDPERIAVVIGNAIGGEKHYATNMRIQYPEFTRELMRSPSFETLPESVRVAILEETQKQFLTGYPEINEDTMPGELANIIAGRIANLFNFRGPNFTTDAACASGLAGLNAAIQGLVAGDYDAAVTGGVDRNMGVAAFVKFCKIGALSATGTRPFDVGADGFVMGEGASLFVLKRLADAERDGDRVYAVILGVAGSSDGKGKGITAPNPVGQQLAVRRAWAKAGCDPASATAVEAHGTSTRVGDAAELESLNKVFGDGSAPVGGIALGSVKSNIGHLKAAAGTAGLLKVALSLHHKKLVPSINVTELNPNVDWSTSPFRVNTELRDWPQPAGDVRRAGVSAFGFGGTNFHVVLEEHVPGRYRDDQSRSFAAADVPQTSTQSSAAVLGKAPLRGALVVGGASDSDVAAQLRTARDRAAEGTLPSAAPPDPALARAAVRVAIDYADADELVAKVDKAVTALTTGNAAMFKMLRSQGVFLGRGPAPKVAFLYTGQGSQYVNMLETLRASEPIVAETFDEADRIMSPLLGRPLTSYVFGGHEPEAIKVMEQQLLQTEITQPAVLASDLALTRLLAAYGIEPDMVMGHSLGEYGALVAAGVMSFDTALEAVSARGHEMASLSVEDNGAMAAVMAPIEDIERIVGAVDGYVVIANVNSTRQAVIGGATVAVEKAVEAFTEAGFTAMRIPVSHAFHTTIVAPASVPLRAALKRLGVRTPQLPIVANVTGEFYPADADEESILDMLARQVASPVQFVRGLRTLYDAGARVFVEVGPKRALHGFTEDVLGAAHDDVVSLFTNHPKAGDLAAFNTALCGLYAAGLGFPAPTPTDPARLPAPAVPAVPVATATATAAAPITTVSRRPMSTDRYTELGHLFADFLEKGREVFAAAAPEPTSGAEPASGEPVVVSGAALGLPSDRVFADDNVARILAGQQFIDLLPRELRRDMVDRHITRLVKSETGDPTFQTIDSENDVIRLAGRHGDWSVVDEFGVDADRDKALDTCTRLAIGAGFDALRDAGIPLVQHYKTTSLGTKLPDRWGLPEELRDGTGVVFASAFPGYDSFARDLNAFWEDRARREQLATLRDVRSRMAADDPAIVEVDRRIGELEHTIETEPFVFDRRFLFKVLSMGHSQFAEIIGARGPNTQVNAACASTTQALSVAEDWIRAGRCERVVVVSADDVTGDGFMPWAGSGFLASGAAATDDVVEEAALPFDRRRHGMIMGMGAAAIVVESAESVRERGLQPICEVLATVTANSAFHGTRLDIDHIGSVMDTLIRRAGRYGVRAADIASRTVFVSHETYTPARGGSASAEINALRHVFGDAAGSVVVTNTKGFTGHAMGAGIEDVVAVKALETGIVPPVANYREPDPDLGPLTLSRGGAYPVDHALRLAAGFGSQVAMALLRWTPLPDGKHRSPAELGYAYRIVDAGRWQAWLDRAAGHSGATLEVKQHRLRVVDTGARAASTPVVAAVVPPGGPSLAALGRPESAALTTAPPVTPVTPTPAPIDRPEPAPLASPPPAAEVATDPVEEAVVSVVEQMTGYGRDLLDLDLDLEADLGVDTVKQAEVFAAVRERFGIPRQENLQLRDFPTLRHVIGFVHDKAPDLPLPAAAGDGAAVPPGGPSLAPLGRPESAALASPAPAVALVSPAPAASVDTDVVSDAVLGIVEQMTGYGRDLLDLDLDLEADLGVDTVKQAEVFAAVRERFGIPRQENLQLRDFPTLRHVIGFVHDKAPAELSEGHRPTGQPESHQSEGLRVQPAFAGDLAATDLLPRRVPVPVLRPALDRCVETGITLGEGSRVLVVPDSGGVGDALVKRLRKLGATVVLLDASSAAPAVEARLTELVAEAPVDGVYWLPALDEEPAIGELDLATWHESLRRRVKNLYAVVRHLDRYARLGTEGTFLVSATRLGGYFGYDPDGATAPLGGAVSGFTKAYKRERPDALVKVVDFPTGRKTAKLAEALVEETLGDPGAVEVGRAADRRWTVGLAETAFGDGTDSLELTPESVVVVTGAAGSIVSAIIADLAKAAGGGTFHLLDLTPEPDPAEEELRLFATDKDALKVRIAEQIKARGDRPTPVLVERELAGYERKQAALTAIQAVTDAGGRVRYHATDLRDESAVAAAVKAVGDESGRIDVLLHAAGLEISRSIDDKEPGEFDLVFDVKSDGWFNLLHAIGDLPLAATVVFSSVAGRFGNAGQTDYSAANDLLCKTSSSFRRTRPDTRAIALDWTAWGGIGMATRGSIPKVMEMAGIDMLPPEAGIAWIRRELTAGNFRGEVVVGGALGVLGAEWHPSGGLDLATTEQAASGLMVGDITSYGVYGGLTAEVRLDPSAQPFLDHHRIGGTAVLPGVMGVETFAEVAKAAVPGLEVVDIEDVQFLAPVKFYRDEPRTLLVHAVPRADGPDVVVDCTLEGTRELKTGVERTVHFTGRVRLATHRPDPEHDDTPTKEADLFVGHDDVYKVYFHGPAYQVLDEAWRYNGGAVGRLAVDLPADRVPPEQPFVTEPRLLELCFQTAGVMEIGLTAVMALPQQAARVVPVRPVEGAAPLYALVHPVGDGSFDCRVVDGDGDVVLRLDGYRTVALPGAVPDELGAPLRNAMDT